jgi:ferritin-like metal-binding protein YciE
MSIDNLQDLMVEELRDMYHAENQLVKALPKLAKAASTPGLKKAFEQHLKQTEAQVGRIDQIFEQLGGSPKGKRCKGMEGLLNEGDDVLNEKGPGAVIDAALIGAAQRVEHYEIAAYGCIRSYALLLGLTDVANLVGQSLEEEEAADQLLSELAETEINALALEGAGGENPDRAG